MNPARIKLLSVAQTAAILVRELGSGRQWVDALSDMRQARGSIAGLRLLPCARLPGGRLDRCSTPLFHPKAIVEFIKAVRQHFGCKQPFDEPVGTYWHDYSDLPTSGHFWRVHVVRPVTKAPATA